MTRIFVEGRDKEFIEVYLSHLYKNDWMGKIRVISTGCYTALYSKTAILNQLTDSIKSGGKNIVIFDADFKENGGSYEQRKLFLEQKLGSVGFSGVDMFLFPNQSEDGDFETLIERVANPLHTRLFSCFKKYENCIKSYNEPKYKTPNRKNMLHSYLFTFVKSEEEEKKFKVSFLYENPEYWDLNATALNPLKEFLNRVLTGII